MGRALPWGALRTPAHGWSSCLVPGMGAARRPPRAAALSPSAACVGTPLDVPGDALGASSFGSLSKRCEEGSFSGFHQKERIPLLVQLLKNSVSVCLVRAFPYMWP